MQTIDFHVHLLSPEMRPGRLPRRLLARFLARWQGIDPDEFLADPYSAYTRGLVRLVRESACLDKIVLFGVDARLDRQGRVVHRDATVCAANEDLLALYRENPDIIIPFFSVNPLRPDALERIDRYVELGFRGGKFLQNYWGVDTREERFSAYFERLRQRGLPLIVHLGSEGCVDSVHACEGIAMLEQPLAAGVTVVAAHMALSYRPLTIWRALSRKSRNFSPDYFRLLELLADHANLYADLSSLLTPVRAGVLAHLAGQEQVHHKLLFATDYPVPFSMVFSPCGLPLATRVALDRIANPFDRAVAALRHFFPEDSPLYSNHRKLLQPGGTCIPARQGARPAQDSGSTSTSM